VLPLAAEGSLPFGKRASEPEPFHAGAGYRLGIPGEQGDRRSPPDLRQRRAGIRRDFPAARIGVLEQRDVHLRDAVAALNELLVPPRELAHDLERRLSGMVAALERVGGQPQPVDIQYGSEQRLGEERIVSEEERAVDVKKN